MLDLFVILFYELFCHMQVDIPGNAAVLVPQTAGYGLDVYSTSHQQRGMRMPQCVGGDSPA